MIDISNIKEVRDLGDTWEITTDNSSGFGLDKKYGREPKVGMQVTCHLHRGSMIRGIELNGVSVFYKSDQELEDDHQKFRIDLRKRREEEFAANKEQMDGDFDVLPPKFKRRIERFRNGDPDFRVEDEAYEMASLKEAVRIADHFKTAEAYDAWWEALPRVYNSKEGAAFEYFAGMDWVDPGHSGHTFGMAIMFAGALLHDKDV